MYYFVNCRSFFLLICIYLFICPAYLHAHQKPKQQTVDSLQQILDKHDTYDTFRVDLLNQIGYEYWIMNPLISEKMGQEALEIARILPYAEGQAFASRVIGVSHWVRGNLDLAFQYLLEAQQLYTDIDDTLGIANSTLNLGMTYASRQDFGMAMAKYEQALHVFQSMHKACRIATTFTKIGNLQIDQGKYEEAYSHLTKALKIYQEEEYLYGISEVNGRLGEMFLKKKEYSKSLSHTLLAIEASSKRLDRVGLGKYFFNLGHAYELQGNKELSVSNYSKSLEYAQKFNLKEVLKDLHLKFKQIEETKGNYRKALSHLEDYNRVKDEIFNLELANTISNLESKHSYQQRQKELELAQKNLELMTERNKTNQSFVIILILALVSIVSILWAILGRQRRQLNGREKDLALASANAYHLQDEIVLKEQEMVSYTLQFVQKNEAISNLKNAISDLKKNVKTENRYSLSRLEKQIGHVLSVDEDWKAFSKHFEQVHPTLTKRLSEEYTNLTKGDYKLIALIRLNLTSKEISNVIGISPDSVKTARYRLRKKLRIQSQQDLFNFLVKIETHKPSLAV